MDVTKLIRHRYIVLVLFLALFLVVYTNFTAHAAPGRLVMSIDENSNSSIALPEGNSGVHISWEIGVGDPAATVCTLSNGWSALKGSGWYTGSLPLGTTTISGECNDAGGNVIATDSVAMWVYKPLQFTGPGSVPSGAQADLTWDVDSNYTCRATEGPGFAVSGPGGGFDRSDPLYADTTFSLECTTRAPYADVPILRGSLTVRVQAAPELDIWIDQAGKSNSSYGIPYNTGVSISWESKNATSCSINNGSWQGLAGVNYGTGPLTKDEVISGTCSGAGGTATDQVTVKVGPTADVWLDLSPTSGSAPNDITVNWGRSLGPGTITCTASGAWSGSKDPSGGSVVLRSQPQGMYDFTLSCSNQSGSAEDTERAVILAGQEVYCSASDKSMTLTEFRSAMSLGKISGSVGISGATAVGTVQNDTDCTAPLVLNSYKMYNDNIAEQTIFAEATGVMRPRGTTSLSVPLPNCKAQADLFYYVPGSVMTESTFSDHLIAWSYGQNSSQFCLRDNAKPDVNITKTGPGNVNIGQEFTYQVTVQNTGQGPAEDVVVRDVFPQSFTFVRSGQGYCVLKASGSVECPVGDISAGSSRSLDFTFQILNQQDCSKSFQNTAEMTGTNFNSLSAQASTQTESCATGVSPSVNVSVVANPGSLQAPNDLQVRWDPVSGTAPITCTASDNWSGSIDSSGGSRAFSGLLAGQYKYTLFCKNQYGSDTDTETVTIVNPSLSCAPVSQDVSSGGQAKFNAQGGLPPFMWSIVSGLGGTLASTTGTTTDLSGSDGQNYTVRLTDAAGQTADCQAKIADKVFPPEADIVSVSPNPVGDGGVVSITWESKYADECHATSGPGFQTNRYINGTTTSSALAYNRAGQTYDFSIVCTGKGGSDTDTETVSVQKVEKQVEEEGEFEETLPVLNVAAYNTKSGKDLGLEIPCGKLQVLWDQPVVEIKKYTLQYFDQKTNRYRDLWSAESKSLQTQIVGAREVLSYTFDPPMKGGRPDESGLYRYRLSFDFKDKAYEGEQVRNSPIAPVPSMQCIPDFGMSSKQVIKVKNIDIDQTKPLSEAIKPASPILAGDLIRYRVNIVNSGMGNHTLPIFVNDSFENMVKPKKGYDIKVDCQNECVSSEVQVPQGINFLLAPKPGKGLDAGGVEKWTIEFTLEVRATKPGLSVYRVKNMAKINGVEVAAPPITIFPDNSTTINEVQ